LLESTECFGIWSSENVVLIMLLQSCLAAAMAFFTSFESATDKHFSTYDKTRNYRDDDVTVHGAVTLLARRHHPCVVPFAPRNLFTLFGAISGKWSTEYLPFFYPWCRRIVLVESSFLCDLAPPKMITINTHCHAMGRCFGIWDSHGCLNSISTARSNLALSLYDAFHL